VVERSAQQLGPQVPAVVTTTTYYDNDQAYFSLWTRLVSNGMYIRSSGLAATDSERAQAPFTRLVRYDCQFFDGVVNVDSSQPGKLISHVYALPYATEPFPEIDIMAATDPFAEIDPTAAPVDDINDIGVRPKLAEVFPDELRRLSYFGPYLTHLAAQFQTDAQNQLQAAGITMNSMPGLKFLQLTTPPTQTSGQSGAIGVIHEGLDDFYKALLKAACWGGRGRSCSACSTS
jgi:hypothetical protein